jgi:hypothetical protein
MPANIAEGPQRSRFIANDYQRFAGNFHGKKTFRIGDGAFDAVHFAAVLVQGSHQLPSAAENAGFFSFQNSRINIKTRSESLRAFNLFVYVDMQWFCKHKNIFLE